MKPSFFLIAILLTCTLVMSAAPSLRPDRLTCEYTQNPLGIAVLKPRLSWTLTSDQRNQKQSAYELVVSDNLAGISKLKGNIWKSGKVKSAENINVAFQGAALKPFTRYHWRVRVFDQDGNPSGWSEPAWFETAMLDANDWQARWIGDDRKQFEKPEDFYGDDPMPLFRKAFQAKKKVESARLYVSGLGYYEAY